MADNQWVQRTTTPSATGHNPDAVVQGLEQYRNTPIEDLMAGIEAAYQQRRDALDVGVSKHNIIIAKNSHIPLYEQAQLIIDEIVKKHPAQFSKPVDLYVHTGPVEGLNNIGGYQHDGAINQFPDRMETSHIALESLAQNPNKLRALLAHELGHTANGDNQIRNLAEFVRTPPSHLKEIRANQMGAILHGNPHEYAESFSAFEQAEGSLTHPSTAQLKKQTLDWANHLTAIGVCNAKGDIVDINTAMHAIDNSAHVATVQSPASGWSKQSPVSSRVTSII